jgi:hypothetical protein
VSRLYLGAKKRKINLVAHYSHLQQTLALPKQVALTAEQLAKFRSIFRHLLRDENFVTLLRAESFTAVPEYLGGHSEEEADTK